MNDNLHDIDDGEIRVISPKKEHIGKSDGKRSLGSDNDASVDDDTLGFLSINDCYRASMEDDSGLAAHEAGPLIRYTSDEKIHRRGASARRWLLVVAALVVAVSALMVALYLWLRPEEDTEENPAELELVVAAEELTLPPIENATATPSPYVTFTDTTAGGSRLSIFKPVAATPTLYVGSEALYDSTAVLVVQAADIRGDNGGIVGAFVNAGELLSKGQAKSGFCAIIDGKITIGVAEATPLLEKVLETDGYFFRQYPLVVANQIVENKLTKSSLRKALAELNGEVVVIMSKERMTLHEFSESLVDLGVTNAIYLVGGYSTGFAVGEYGERIEFGNKKRQLPPNSNYIVWR